MGETNIGWTDFSTNPIRARLAGMTTTKGGYASGVGHYCEKVSAGCTRCYASELQPRFGLPEFQAQRNGKVEVFFDPSKLEEVLRIKKPKRVFWCDMTDMFGSWVPFEWIAACFGAMAATPHLIHQVLTKRPERALEFFRWIRTAARCGIAGCERLDIQHIVEFCGNQARKLGATNDEAFTLLGMRVQWPLPNVHLGVSVEDQKTVRERIPYLMECPAAVRWASAEPLLARTSLDRALLVCGSCRTEDVVKGPPGIDWLPTDNSKVTWKPQALRGVDQRTLDWVVVGGESGPERRDCDPAWVDLIVAQCTAARVPVFVKQDSGPKPGKQGRLSAATWARKEFPRGTQGGEAGR